MPPIPCRYYTDTHTPNAPHSHNIKTSFKRHPRLLSRFLLPSLHSPRLRGLFPVTPYHDCAQEAAHNRRCEEDEDDGDPDGPDAGREEVVEGVALIDEGLKRGGEEADVSECLWRKL